MRLCRLCGYAGYTEVPMISIFFPLSLEHSISCSIVIHTLNQLPYRHSVNVCPDAQPYAHLSHGDMATFLGKHRLNEKYQKAWGVSVSCITCITCITCISASRHGPGARSHVDLMICMLCMLCSYARYTEVPRISIKIIPYPSHQP